MSIYGRKDKMKSKCTPEPWGVGDLDRNEQRRVIAENGRLVVVCAHESVGSLVPEMEANAILIAAAPDLLRELKFMVRDWIEIVGDEDENRTPADRLEKAKAAIAKAEGKGQ